MLPSSAFYEQEAAGAAGASMQRTYLRDSEGHAVPFAPTFSRLEVFFVAEQTTPDIAIVVARNALAQFPVAVCVL